jgi:hypothetical protein
MLPLRWKGTGRKPIPPEWRYVVDEVRTLAQAQTLTLLERLTPDRKRVVMQFLVEADLIKPVRGGAPIIKLSHDPADPTLSEYGTGANLKGVDLHGLEQVDSWQVGPDQVGPEKEGLS